MEAYPEVVETLESNWEQYIPIIMNYDSSLKIVSAKLKKYFVPPKPENSRISRAIQLENDVAFLKNITRLFGDRMFNQPVHDAASFHKEFAPTYLYYYSYLSKRFPGVVYAILKGVQPLYSSRLPPNARIASLVAKDVIARLVSPEIRAKHKSIGKLNCKFFNETIDLTELNVTHK